MAAEVERSHLVINLISDFFSLCVLQYAASGGLVTILYLIVLPSFTYTISIFLFPVIFFKALNISIAGTFFFTSFIIFMSSINY